MVTQVFIDCTHTYGTLANTGIQRVVRSVLLHALESGSLLGLECIPVAYDGENFRRVDVSPLRVPRRPTRRSMYVGYVRTFYQRARQAVYRALPFELVHRFLFAPKHAFGLTRLLYVPVRIARRLRAARSGHARVSFGRDSILLMLDAPVGLDPWGCVRSAKKEGAFVVGTIYDLLPVDFPELFLPSLRGAFDDWIRNAVRDCDALMTISKAMQDELEAFIRRDITHAPPPVACFPLGFELDWAETSAPVREEIVALFDSSNSAGPMFMTVGTVEPRKDHLTVIGAFSRLWRSGVDVRLFVIGAVGWKCERVVEAISRHPELHRRLFWFKDLSDAELAYCYRHAKGVVAASIAEGSGLPLIEALARGLPVVASEIAVFREIGGASARYFPVGDEVKLAEHVHTLLDHVRSDTQSITWPGWRECTRTLLERIVELRERDRAPREANQDIPLPESSGLAA